jgi:hypothetical protein
MFFSKASFAAQGSISRLEGSARVEGDMGAFIDW